MNKIILFLLISLLLSPSAFAEKRFMGFRDNQNGIGMLIGVPTKFRYQHWLNWKQSLLFDGGYHFSDQVIVAEAAYAFYFYDAKDLWRSNSIFNSTMFYLAPGVVLGAGLSSADAKNSFQLAVKGIGGMDYIFTGTPWVFRAELGMVGYFAGRTTFGLQAGIGFMYYLDQASPTKKEERHFH